MSRASRARTRAEGRGRQARRAAGGRSAATTLARGLAAIITLIVLVAGLPVLLYRLGGSPVPRHLPGWAELGHALTRRDNGTLFLGAVRDISWLAWAAFSVAVLAELQAAARGKIAPRLRLGGLQSAAGNLVAFAMLTFSGSATVLAVPLGATSAVAASRPVPGPATEPETLAVSQHPATSAAQVTTSAAQVRSMGHYQLVTVRPGDCLWTLAQRHLGDGDRYTEIAGLNLGHDMGGGVHFTDPSLIIPGWVLQVPGQGAAAPASQPPDTGQPGAEPGEAHRHPASGEHRHGTAAAVHQPHPSREPAFRTPHPAASAATQEPSRPVAPVSGGTPVPANPPGPAGPPAAGQAAANAAPSRAATAAGELAVFAAGMVAGGAAVTLSRMRHRQRQGRRFGRRIPLPASAPVMEAEHRLRADAPPVPATSLRAALGVLSAGLASAGRPVPEIGAIRIRPQLMEVLLASPSAGAPPRPFLMGDDQMTWQLPLPLPPEPRRGLAAMAGDLLPGLVTLGASDDGYLLIDLEYLRVTVVDGPPVLADQVLTTAAAELATSGLAGWYDLILVGFSELAVVGGRATCCDDFDSALDLVAAKAVTLRRRLGVSDPAAVRSRRITEPGDEDWALTLLVSRINPTASEQALLRDLAADPGGIAALVPAGTGAGPGVPDSCIELDGDPAQPGGMVATVTPLGLVAFPQPLDDVDYRALAGLFTTAARDDDVAPDDPPYDRTGSREAWRGEDAGPADEYEDFWRDTGKADDGWLAGVRDGTGWPAGTAEDDAWPPPQDAPLDAGADDDWTAQGLRRPPDEDPGEPQASGSEHDASAANGAGDSQAADQGAVFRWQPDRSAGQAGPAPDGASGPWDDASGISPAHNWRQVSEPDSPDPLAGGGGRAEGFPRHARPADAHLSLRIGVLGTFTVNGEPGALLPAQSQLLLALAVHGKEGLSNRQLCELLGADPDHPKPSDSLRQLMVRTRRQLGRAADGREWIEHLGAGQYALHPQARVDWYEFDALARDGIRHRDPQLLTDALRMLRGEPFTGCYYWWLDAALLESVRAQVVDAAEMLSGLELSGGDPAGAARAARTGLAADPAAEQLWRALMRAEHAAGNLSGVRDAWTRCLDVIGEIAADGEPHPDTSTLYHQLLARSASRTARLPG